ncbi:rhodanese-like domain-containing protein [Rhodohalobacter mucosus]|uniref:NADH oxidase n=1 Tax=Rhodohalobacter mucosus TaxID=2079485 RepID=A0A316TTG8_9BACT|nr:rhodanese-like domain-containing protein [Rhodohalobacter mucosus]PWN05562.1 NADH oxidase [Rhodohalobacter mucosus]
MKETTAEELKERMDSGDDFTLLDVREPHEYYMADLEGTTRIPFDELNSRMDELNKKQEIIVLCRSGSSAGDAVELLTENGFVKSSRLKGGINEWAAKIDPSIPQY